MARRGGRTIDYKEWAFMPFADMSTITANGTTLSAGVLPFVRAATILRCRGFVQANFDETQQVGDRMILTWGLGIVSTDASIAGSASMPDPAGEAEYPWMWWNTLVLRSNLAAGINSWGSSNQRLDIDTKAMRRVKPGQSLVMVIEASGASGAPVTEVITSQIRVLIGT